MTRLLRKGDHVWVGEPGPGKVHWEIDSVNEAGTHATLISGQTTRRMYHVALESLTLHTPAPQEGATS